VPNMQFQQTVKALAFSTTKSNLNFVMSFNLSGSLDPAGFSVRSKTECAMALQDIVSMPLEA